MRATFCLLALLLFSQTSVRAEDGGSSLAPTYSAASIVNSATNRYGTLAPNTIATIYAQPMAPLTVYNVKKAVWHTHTLSPDAKVLVVENRDTTYDNSPFCALTQGQRQTLAQMAAEKGF